MYSIQQGDLVISKVGRDSGKTFLVLKVENNFVYIVNGKERKVSNPKKKNVKHLIKISNASLIELAERINNGERVGNKTVYRNLKAEKEKLQED